jgi:hypothetical protein
MRCLRVMLQIGIRRAAAASVDCDQTVMRLAVSQRSVLRKHSAGV